MSDTALIQLDLQDFLWNGILKEAVFREKLETHDWSQYRARKVIIKGCGEVPIPTWAYMVVAATLVDSGAEKIMYGEPCAAVPVFRKSKRADLTEHSDAETSETV